MSALMGILLVAATAPNAARSAEICDVGRVALRDLPSINQNPGFDTYYSGVGQYYTDLLTACPELVVDLPAGYPLANDDARSRASAGAPRPGVRIREAFIYFIEVPKVSGDRKTAVVRMGYFCTGLCGASSEARYVRTAQGWQRQGNIRILSVS